MNVVAGQIDNSARLPSERSLEGCLHGGRKILAPGRKKSDHSSAICFLYPVYKQKVVVFLDARIFWRKLKKILAPCKFSFRARKILNIFNFGGGGGGGSFRG